MSKHAYQERENDQLKYDNNGDPVLRTVQTGALKLSFCLQTRVVSASRIHNSLHTPISHQSLWHSPRQQTISRMTCHSKNQDY